MIDVIQQPERAILVSVVKKGSDRDKVNEHLKELESLAKTAGAEIADKLVQELEKPNPATAIGKGKVEELKQTIADKNVQIVIFDDDLTPAQVRNLEIELNIKVIDRSGLILDIFAKHAQSIEAKTQVELAQSQYLLPRLTKMWTHLSKQFGGIGTKGPGETQIESDRRVLRIKIQKLKEKLEEISVQREQQRKGRDMLPRFALVGYTNAGKSTLLNIITNFDAFVEDKLFATLDTTVKSFQLPSGQKALLSDTVGFIRKLPTHLVASFRSTLAEAAEADVLVHVVDISHEYFHDHIRVVNDTLEFLNIHNKPTILVFNKVDKLPDRDFLRTLENEYPDSIFISARRAINLIGLLHLMQKKYDDATKVFHLKLPYTKMDLLSKLYSLTEVLNREDKDDGISFFVRVLKEKSDIFNLHFSKYIQKQSNE